MKKLFTFCAIVALTTISAVSFAQAKTPVWEPLKNFHTIMAATFHPAEEGNLAPLRSMKDSLYLSATTWQKSPIPMNYKEKETRAALKDLVKQTKKIKQAVDKNESDKDLTEMITEAHEIFHKIVGECKMSEEEMKDHKGHGEEKKEAKEDEHKGHNHG